MEFEFDPAKSAANKAKHGIDFVEARKLWSDPQRVFAPALVVSEPRLVAIGRIGGRIWTAIFTWRGDRIRIISVRRARKKEAERYEEG